MVTIERELCLKVVVHLNLPSVRVPRVLRTCAANYLCEIREKYSKYAFEKYVVEKSFINLIRFLHFPNPSFPGRWRSCANTLPNLCIYTLTSFVIRLS